MGPSSAAGQERALAVASESSQLVNRQGLAVVVVDQRPLASLHLGLLEAKRTRFFLAQDARTARELVASYPPNVVIVALDVAATAGMELLRELCEPRGAVATVLVTETLDAPLGGQVDLLLSGPERRRAMREVLEWLGRDGDALGLAVLMRRARAAASR